MYRKIVVDGKQYEYVIGKSHTKIKGVGVFPNLDVGPILAIERYCECCGTPMSELYPNNTPEMAITITPKDIAAKIKAFQLL
jgi:hypothetical protein